MLKLWWWQMALVPVLCALWVWSDPQSFRGPDSSLMLLPALLLPALIWSALIFLLNLVSPETNPVSRRSGFICLLLMVPMFYICITVTNCLAARSTTSLAQLLRTAFVLLLLGAWIFGLHDIRKYLFRADGMGALATRSMLMVVGALSAAGLAAQF